MKIVGVKSIVSPGNIRCGATSFEHCENILHLLTLLLFLATTGFYTNSFAANWQVLKLPSREGGGYLQIDRDSILRRGNLISVWTRALYPEGLEIPNSAHVRARVVMALTDYSCSNITETTRRVLYFQGDESQLVLAERGPFATSEVIPDTIRDEVLALLCQAK